MMTMMQKGTIAKVAPSSPEKILLQFLFSPRPLMENMKFTRCVEWWSGGDDGRCTLHMYDGASAYLSARVLLNPNHRYRRCFSQIATTCPICSTYVSYTQTEILLILCFFFLLFGKYYYSYRIRDAKIILVAMSTT